MGGFPTVGEGTEGWVNTCLVLAEFRIGLPYVSAGPGRRMEIIYYNSIYNIGNNIM